MAAGVVSNNGQQPNNTVYVRNLEERIKLEPLKEALREIFSEYGNIIDVVAKKSLKARGQAFVVFDDTESATQAIDEIQGFELFEKPMVLDYAKTWSDAAVKLQGSEEDYEAHKRKRLAEKERKQALEAQEASKKLKRPTATAPANEPAPARPTKTAKSTGLKSTGGAAAVIPDEYLPPNKILFIQNVPESYDVEALSAIFGQFDGFREVRTVPGRKGIAFVEYEAESGAITAKENTAGKVVGEEEKPIKVTFQRQ